MTFKRILGLVLAGGKGTRLRPLTDRHAKPALPFAGGLRIVDFVLSNLYNSKIGHIYVLAQYKPHSLIEHLNQAWGLSSLHGDRFLEVLLPRQDGQEEGFRGTADAVYQNISVIDRHRPDLVAVFAADHVYRMDIRQMAEFHESHGADVSVSAVPVPVERASSFGIICADAEGRVDEFHEKPERPKTIPFKPGQAYASMGNYLFKPDVLVDALRRANKQGEHDFGRHVLPRLTRSHRIYAYNFATNNVPGARSHEEPAYWRDVGTVEAYRAAQRDVVGRAPRFQLRNPEWPIRRIPADRTELGPRDPGEGLPLRLPPVRVTGRPIVTEPEAAGQERSSLSHEQR